MEKTKILLQEDDIPKAWYNIIPDLPRPLDPPLHPVEKRPIGPEDLLPIFPMGLIEQEVSNERWIEIPEEVREVYKIFRPSPLVRAKRLEKALKTPAHIYYKYEGGSPPGSHKTNTAIAQAYYNKKEGKKGLTSETGAGQWGSALSFACKLLEMDCRIYMVKVSYNNKPYRRMLIETYGGKVIPSPSDDTKAGRGILSKHPDSPGSLGIAISEAVEYAASHKEINYTLGSVLNHVILHQTVIGLEAKKQMEMAGEYPDVIVACVGGGSNLGGISFPFLHDRLTGKAKPRVMAIEPATCPKITKGVYAYDYGDTAMLTPIMKMHTLGHDFMPAPIHAGGLRYHGDSPLVSLLNEEGLIDAKAYHQNEVFAGGLLFAQTEGLLPAPESAHAVKGAIDEAIAARESGEKKVILFGLSGHGYFDIPAYDSYLAGKLTDDEYSDKELRESLVTLPKI